MTRKEKIEKAKKLTLANRGHNIFLDRNYIEATPEEVAKRITCVYTEQQKGKTQIWYIDKHGTARVVDDLKYEWDV